MKNLILIIVCVLIPVLTFGQKTEKDLIGVWDRDNMSFKGDQWESGEDFFTHVEFRDDSHCSMNNHYGTVYAMTYGTTTAKWSLDNKILTIHRQAKATQGVSGSLDLKFTCKISRQSAEISGSKTTVLCLEIKNIETGKKYLFYKTPS